MMKTNLLVSFVLATHDRLATLLHTLHRIDACGLPHTEYEIFVVDNASTDGTADCLSRERPDVHLLALDENRGSCAKALALPHTTGQFIIFLDDDSYPLADSVQRMVSHFEEDPYLGAAGFVVHLPDGRQECSALPNVFIGCGVGFSRAILMAAGGLDLSYFMAAEEYDLSFRLIQAGYEVKTFADLHVFHLKSAASRHHRPILYYDLRNNLTLAATYLPNPWHREFIRDWEQRYFWLAQSGLPGRPDCQREYQEWRCWGYLRGYTRRWSRPRLRLNDAAMQKLFGISHIAAEMDKLPREGFRRVLFADLGKNIYPYFKAAAQAGIHLEAIMDDHFAQPGRSYRGVPIVPYEVGLSLNADAIVISNSSPVHARLSEQRLRAKTDLPVYRWHGRYEFENCPRCLQERSQVDSTLVHCMLHHISQRW